MMILALLKYEIREIAPSLYPNTFVGEGRSSPFSQMTFCPIG